MELSTFTSEDGVVILKSPQLDSAGFKHAFSTRKGPAGKPFDLSRPGYSRIHTPKDTCQKHLSRFCQLISPESQVHLNTPRQMHGREIALACSADMQEADAVISDDDGFLAGIRTADCMGILIACPASGRVAAVHAGWRGLVSDIPGNVVNALKTMGGSTSDPSQMIAALGPSIGAAVYEVGQEVAQTFSENGLEHSVRPANGSTRKKSHLDVHHAATQRLIDAGLKPSKIDGNPLCTSKIDLFYSYRNEGPECGRLMAAILPI